MQLKFDPLPSRRRPWSKSTAPHVRGAAMPRAPALFSIEENYDGEQSDPL
jgi:hypothetical protein